MTGAPLLSCRGLSLAVRGRTLVTGLDLDVRAGECWAIVGPNGAGKTTLVATLAGLRAPAAGEIAYDGTPLATLGARERALRRGFLPQDTVDFFPATVLETALVGRHPHLSRWQWESADDVARARAALASFGLGGLDARDARTLSGGERRRLALTALVAQDPHLLLLDEPSSHLDLGQQVAALDVVTALAKRGDRAIVMVLHDLHLALRYADHAIALGGGRARTGTAAQVLTAATLSELMGHPLVAVGAGTSATFVPV
ncbi:MAG: ABC transporter ATP-binding protein [Betaproteobacteria bacterium]